MHKDKKTEENKDPKVKPVVPPNSIPKTNPEFVPGPVNPKGFPPQKEKTPPGKHTIPNLPNETLV